MFPTSTLSLNRFSSCFPLPALTSLQLSAPQLHSETLGVFQLSALDHLTMVLKQPVYNCSPYAKEQFVRDFSVFCEEAILLCGMYLD